MEVELIMKTLIYRWLGSTITLIITYLATGRLELAFGLSACDFFGKLIFYYVFELVWKKIKAKQ